MDKVINPGCTLELSGKLLLDVHAWNNPEVLTRKLWGWDLNISSKQQLKPDLEHWTSSKLGKEFVKAVYCHLAYLTYMQHTPYKMLDWMKHKLESILQGRNVNNLRYADDTTLMAGREEDLKEPLDESERGE